MNQLNSLTASRLAPVMHANGLSASSWEYYHPYTHAYNAVCAGFFMGPARYLVELLECVRQKGWAGGFDDQRGATLCMLERPQLVTIDYTGTLVIDLYGFPEHVLSFADGRIVNNLANATQCFAHANGHTSPQPFGWFGWEQQLTAGFANSERVVEVRADDHCINKHVTGFLQTHNGTFLDANDTHVKARWKKMGAWQQWAIEREGGGNVRSGDTVFLKDWSGEFLDVEGTEVRTRWSDRGHLQRFVIEKELGHGMVCAGDAVFLRAHTGNYLEVEGSEVRAKEQNKTSLQRFVVSVQE